MSVWAIVVAAGSGARFGAAKQFARLGGITVLDRAVGVASECSDGVVVVLGPDADWSPPAGVDVVAGGATRSASVRNGLERVPADADVVVVHDAARPLASRGLFVAVVEAVRAGADAAIPALPVVDTVKRVDGAHVIETVPREDLVVVQTPQAFRADALRKAHAAADVSTDDAALVEAAGGTVVVVPGEPRNLKLTVTADLELAHALLDSGGAP
ncbi:MAG TPA: 2-C-methyl-D-erythritol 4-phosphate cytidylyltransferase [Acidimicrobiia bacterium]|nr:2-C-methyl-D-erythritol 4-phosphate cytidylyltransferase [Acidimicrobiia bacterium]